MAEKENNSIKSEAALREEWILQFWKDNKVFEKTLDPKTAPSGSDKGNFVFYDGPPYATGEPHYGHLLPGTIKDVIPRYKTMKGFHIDRQWGWDCHGLPIENLVEKELGLKSKKEIEEYGIDKFNQAAKNSVLRYESTWKEMIPRTGRWADMENPYMTMTPNYMESIWWAFKSLHEKGLVNKGFKPMHICPRCETPLANFEVNQGYTDVKDLTVTAKFKVVGEDNTYFLAWTTTPWTLPGNVALAVGGDIDYVKVKTGDDYFFLAKNLTEKVFKDITFEIVKELKGKDLVGLLYEPLFDYYNKAEKLENKENGWKVYGADFVTTEDGTGIVHIAPAFGSDDLALGQKYNLPFVQHINNRGEFKPEVTDFAGMVVKKKDDTMSVDIEVLKNLAERGLLFSKEKITHSYPLCWRCDTPLLNYATDSWFIDVPKIKDRLLANNAKTRWIPEHVRDGRFGKWLEGAREWAVSRSRYWGTPLPVWEKTNGEYLVIGSQEELKNYAGDQITRIIFVRHGEAEHNVLNMSSSALDLHPLTEKGELQAKRTAEILAKENIDVVFGSPILRARQTAGFYTTITGKEMIFDERLGEIKSGNWEERPGSELDMAETRKKYKALPIEERYLFKRGETGESWADVDERVQSFLDEVLEKYKGKTVLCFSHQGTGSTAVKLLKGYTNEEAIAKIYYNLSIVGNAARASLYVDTSKKRELDLHRPYIDDIKLTDEEGNEMKRVEDVFDVWFDSGAMPYAKSHYPFENKEEFEKTLFPANFIAEGQDQTRGWFYTLSVLGTALFDKFPFETVVVNGMVLAEDGKKMSKRLKNYPEIGYMLDKYGADAIRLFLMSSPAVHAEDVNFVEKSVAEIASKVIGRLQNSLEFYKLYENDEPAIGDSDNVLDQWIVARVKQVHGEMSDAIEEYVVDKACRPFFDLIDDLSTWYVRRSRDRFKNEGEDKTKALGTMRFVLQKIAQIMAPFTPFISEVVWQDVREEKAPISIHLTFIPGKVEYDKKIIEDMKTVREIVRLGLEARQKASVKVRQPLSKLQITNYKLQEIYFELIKDELNVKEVIVVGKRSDLKNLEKSDLEETTVELDTEITPDLKREGDYRELIREIQDMRKEKGLIPNDKIILTIPEKYRETITGFETEIKKTVGATETKFGDELGLEKI